MALNDAQDRGYKARILRELFFEKYNSNNPQDVIFISIDEVIERADRHGRRPGNIHNFFKDAVRTGKMPHSLSDIANLGYFLRQVDRGGEFVLVGDAEYTDDIFDAILLPDDIEAIEINASNTPSIVWDLVRDDEGGALSVVEYCNMLDVIAGTYVYRVQTPVKVSPNEIDGLYVFLSHNDRIIFSAEAKSKGPDVLLKHQIYGEAGKALEFYGDIVSAIIPLGIKIAQDNTVYIVVFDEYTQENQRPRITDIYRFLPSPIPPSWIRRRGGRTRW